MWWSTLVLIACSHAGAPVDQAVDVAPDVDSADGNRAMDGSDGDAGGELPAGLTQLTLRDGSRVRGQLVATYDQSIWWDAAEAETYALFDAAGFAAYPDDRSMRFISSRDVTGRTTAPGAIEGIAYRDWLRARQIVSLRPPLAAVAYVITGNESYHLEENGFGDFAWDVVRTDSNGQRFTGTGGANPDYLVWREPVYLPTGGVVVEVVRDVPDNAPGSYPDEAPENLVGVALGGQYYLYLLHFRQGTIPSPDDATCEPAVEGVSCIVIGADLPAGTYLGEVGNSGTSLEPHVHLTLLFFDSTADPPRSWSVPSELADVWVSDSPSGPAERREYGVPQSGQWISGAEF